MVQKPSSAQWKRNPGLTLVTLGPLTNVALALAERPAIAEKIGRCVVMGGNPCCEGNVTPAALQPVGGSGGGRTVLRSACPSNWWAGISAAATPRSIPIIRRVLSFGTPPARFAIECNSTAMEAYRPQTGETGISLPDPVAMSIALDPGVCTSASRHHVDVEVASDLTRGMSVVDRLNVGGDERNRPVWEDVEERK